MANEVTIHVKAKDDASKTMSNVGKSAKGMGVAVGAAALAVGGVLVKALSDSVAAAQESNKIHAQTTAVLRSTGHAAGITGKQVDAMASRISKLTGVDDELIQSGENILLTFTNVRNDMKHGNMIFDEATMAITDMSVALGQDMKTSAIQVGKALNDPVKGMTALKRVGVTFNKEQEKTIKHLVKTGHVAEAQKVILAELTKEFGGSAAAQATWADKAKVAFGNIQEAVGKALLPSLNRAAKWFVNHEDDIAGFAANIGDAAKATGDFVSAIDKLGKKGGGLDKLMRANKTGMKMGGGLEDALAELSSWKAHVLRIADDVAGAWAMLGLLPKKYAKKIHAMRVDADNQLAEHQKKFNETRNKFNKGKWEAKIKADKSDLEKKYRESKARLDYLKKQKPTPHVRAEIRQAMEAMRKAKYALQQLDGMTARVHVKTVYSGLNAKNAGAPFHASGGNIGAQGHAAEGGARGGQTWVGEQGPELVDLPFGSHVNSNADSMRKASQQGGGGSVHITINAPNITDRDGLRRMLVDMQRRGQLDVIRR